MRGAISGSKDESKNGMDRLYEASLVCAAYKKGVKSPKNYIERLRQYQENERSDDEERNQLYADVNCMMEARVVRHFHYTMTFCVLQMVMIGVAIVSVVVGTVCIGPSSCECLVVH